MKVGAWHAFEQDFYQAGEGIIVDGRLWNPDVVRGKRGTLIRLPQVEVGIEYAVGKDVLDVLAQQYCATWYCFRLPRLIKTLPDVSCTTAVDGGLALIPYIYKNKVSFANLQSLQLYWQFLDAVGTESLATIHEWATLAFGRLGRTLDGTKVHDGLVVKGGLPRPLQKEG